MDLIWTLGIIATEAGSTGSADSMRSWAYAGFLALVIGLLALDLGVFHREARETTFREAAGWSVVWLGVGLSFCVFVYHAYEGKWLGLGTNTLMYSDTGTVRGSVDGLQAAKQYLTAYIVEKSLAMDNIFVIAMIFSYFVVPAKYQHRVLFWGIVGAVVMRGAMIAIAGEIVSRWMWVLIIFGAFLLVTSVKMAVVSAESDLSENLVVRLVRRCVPVVTFYDGQRFFTRRTLAPTYTRQESGDLKQDPPPPGSLGRLSATPLLLALVLVEVSDLIFAVDSIPAVFAITPDQFIVFTSNIFAILGLRALYFCLAAMIVKFRFLKPALILILAFVGVKLLLLSVPPYLHVVKLAQGPVNSIKIGTGVSLAVVLSVLVLAVVLSVLFPKREAEHASGVGQGV